MSKKKKKKKQKHYDEDEDLLDSIDKDILSQYRSIREDVEAFQYQLMIADKKTKKKYNKALKTGKPFNFRECESVKARKKIIKEMEENSFIGRIMYLYTEWSPVVKLLGRCIALFVVALLSVDIIKSTISKDNLDKLDKIFKMSMSI